jgi:hypothetical protein
VHLLQLQAATTPNRAVLMAPSFSRVVIKNWRSIKEVEFCPSDMTILVGANNGGKTNIWSAINLLIGERWPMPGNLAEAEFYNRDQPIYIRLDFEDAPYGRLEFDTGLPQYNLKACDQRPTRRQVRPFANDDRV